MKTAIFKKSREKLMAEIPTNEIVKAIKDLTPGAYQLLMYFYSRNDGWVFRDKVILSDIGVQLRTLKLYKKELTDKGYLLIMSGAVDVYFIGQKAVNKYFNDLKKANENEASLEEEQKTESNSTVVHPAR